MRLTRGEPLCYCQFETVPQDRPVQLIEAARTPELDAYLEHISGAVNFVNQSFSLFKTAEERRPKILVVRKSVDLETCFLRADGEMPGSG